MKKIILVVLLLIVMAGGFLFMKPSDGADSSEENIEAKADDPKAEPAKAETGETQIGEATAAAETPTDAGGEAAVPAAAEAAAEPKVETARYAVLGFVPAGTYTWRVKSADGERLLETKTLEVRQHRAAVETTQDGKKYNYDILNFGDGPCLQRTLSHSLTCYHVSGPDENGVYKADVTDHGGNKTTLTPVQ